LRTRASDAHQQSQPITHRERNMAGASDPLEDMLFSEVTEKAVSDLWSRWSLSWWARASRPPRARAREAAAAAQTGDSAGCLLLGDLHQNHNNKRTAAERAKARATDSDRKDASMDKHAKGSGEGSPLKSHGSIIIITTAAAAAASEAPAPATKVKPRRHRTEAAGIRARCAPQHPQSQAQRKRRSISIKQHHPATSSTTVTVSSNPQAIALDRGTPTIALHTTSASHHRPASADGNGTSCPRWSSSGAAINHSKTPATTTRSQRPLSHSSVCQATVSAARSSDPRRRRRRRSTQTPAQQRVVTPQLIVRHPQQQTYYTVPPGFTHPSRYLCLTSV
ncbi:hypothetical protein cypCar_00038990, partial [Cyprinus carpio]